MIIEKKCPVIERYETKNEIDLRLLKKRGNEKTFSGWMIQRMKIAREEKNFEMVELLQSIYKKHLEYETSERIKFESWKGQSGIKIFLRPDKIIVLRYQKREKDSEPVEIKTEIMKNDINDVINSINKINKLNPGEKIESSTIASTTYQEEWKDIFSNRSLHIQFTHILGILEFYNLIKYYRSGKVQVLKNVREIQEVLK
jgi:hypothetical protein